MVVCQIFKYSTHKPVQLVMYMYCVKGQYMYAVTPPRKWKGVSKLMS